MTSCFDVQGSGTTGSTCSPPILKDACCYGKGLIFEVPFCIGDDTVNKIGFRGAIPQHITCTLHGVVTTPVKSPSIAT